MRISPQSTQVVLVYPVKVVKCCVCSVFECGHAARFRRRLSAYADDVQPSSLVHVGIFVFGCLLVVGEEYKSIA